MADPFFRFRVYSSMRNFCLILISFISLNLNAQNLQGDWLLAYIVSIPPEMSVGEDGAINLDGTRGTENVESFVEQGIMLLSIQANGSASSFYLDIEEEWNVVQDGNKVTFESEADTLYGKYNDQGMLQLRSVIDEFPTEYFFAPYNPQAFDLDLVNTSWKVSDEGFLNGKTIEFKTNKALRIWSDGKALETDYILYQIDQFYAIELSSPDFETGFGIIYLEKSEGKTLQGIMYIIAADTPPKQVKVQLSKL